MNEPRNGHANAAKELQAWIVTMSAFVKRMAPYQLVTVGDEVRAPHLHGHRASCLSCSWRRRAVLAGVIICLSQMQYLIGRPRGYVPYHSQGFYQPSMCQSDECALFL